MTSRPTGMVSVDNFELRTHDFPELADGEILIRATYLSFEPAMRGWMDDKPSYLPPVELGAVMRAPGTGEVVESRDPKFAVGDTVSGFIGWNEYMVRHADSEMPLSKLPEGVPPTLPMGVLGGAGMTAYNGLDICAPAPGETFVVSGAAGAVGSITGQLAKHRGARVVGIAGGPAKCAWVTGEAGFDACIDYKDADLDAALEAECPDGIDCYFDNVGGDTLNAVLANLAWHGRIALCGAISQYNDVEPSPGPSNLFNLVSRRGMMQGFIVMDFAPRYDEARAELGALYMDGKIAFREDIQHGFDNVPSTFLRLFSGENQGKQLLEL